MYRLCKLSCTFPSLAKYPRRSLEQAFTTRRTIDETKLMCFKQDGAVTTLNDKALKLGDFFTYLCSNITSTESDANIWIITWSAIERSSVIWKSNLSNKVKWEFFQAVAVSMLLYGCTTWTLSNCLEKKLDWNYIRMLRAVLNKPRSHMRPIKFSGILRYKETA